MLLVPHTLALRFDLSIQPSTADARCCVNNIARNIVSRMEIKFAGETLIDLNRYDLYHTYKDLFMWPKDRAELVEWGIGSAAVRKVRSKTSGASGAATGSGRMALSMSFPWTSKLYQSMGRSIRAY